MLGFRAHRPPVDAARARQRRVTKEDVFGDAELGKQQQFLIDRRHAGAARIVRRGKLDLRPVDQNRTSVGLIDAGHDLDQRRFARAVLAEQRVDLARADVERNARERAHAGKRFLDLAHLEQRSGPAGRGLSLQRRAHAASVARVSGSTTIVSTPASAQHGERFRRRGAVGDERMDARQRTDHEAAALREFRSVRQNDQFIRAPQKFHLRARDQRIALDHAKRADRDGAHEHDARRIVLDRVVIEWRDNDFLLAVDLAAGQDDAVLRFPDKKLGERVGVGQDLEPGVSARIPPSGTSLCRR